MLKKQLKKIRAVIYDIKDGQPYFLIFHRILRWTGWELMKETIKSKETNKQTLIRGIKEETKLKDFKIIKSLDKQEKWQALGNECFVVDTFLIKADMNQEISLGNEHDSYQWINKEKAIKKLTHNKSKDLIWNLILE